MWLKTLRLVQVHEEFFRGTLSEGVTEFGSRETKVILSRLLFQRVQSCSVPVDLKHVARKTQRHMLYDSWEQFQAYDARDSACKLQGEVTIVVEGASAKGETMSEEELCERVLELLGEGCSPSSTAKILSRGLNIARSPVYTMALKLKQSVVQREDRLPPPP